MRKIGRDKEKERKNRTRYKERGGRYSVQDRI